MGILGKEYICPELDCPNIKEGKKGRVCPVCGTEFKKMASFQANNLKIFKQMNKEEKSKLQSNNEEQHNKKAISRNKNILASDKKSDEEIKAKIYTELDNLVKADIDWEELDLLLSSNPDAQIGLKTIIEQNKLIILQNELIYRELKKINDKDN